MDTTNPEPDTAGGVTKTYFSNEHLALLEEEYRAIPGKCQKLSGDFLRHNYNNARAREYAIHGFSRRLNTLARCIENTFGILPPDIPGLPTREQLSDAAINVQAFVFNVFGSLDNLAWVWVSEKGLTKNDGSPIPNTWVGLKSGNTLVRSSFSPEFQKYLLELDAWFNYLEDFRHALAHKSRSISPLTWCRRPTKRPTGSTKTGWTRLPRAVISLSMTGCRMSKTRSVFSGHG